eukprot:g44887.t1
MAQPGSLTGFNIFRRLYWVLVKGTAKIVEARNVKFGKWARGHTANVLARPWAFDNPPIPQPNPLTKEPVTAVDQKIVVKPDPTQSGNDPGQSTFQLNDDDDVDNGYQPLDDQPIPAPQPPPQPAQLEELQPIVRQSLVFLAQFARLGLAPPSSSSANGSLAPRDINRSISSANIIASPRERKQTPAYHSTHHVSLAEDSQTDCLIDVDVACNLERFNEVLRRSSLLRKLNW